MTRQPLDQAVTKVNTICQGIVLVLSAYSVKSNPPKYKHLISKTKFFKCIKEFLLPGTCICGKALRNAQALSFPLNWVVLSGLKDITYYNFYFKVLFFFYFVFLVKKSLIYK